jgi:hypothetical protein
MGTLRSELRTRFQNRIGLTNVLTAEADAQNELLDAAVSRAIADGAPGLTTDMMVGESLGSLAVTLTTAAAGSATVTASGATLQSDRVCPGDILTTASGDEYLIRAVPSEETLDLGIPLAAADAGAASILRRSLCLPSAGQVLAVTPEGSDRGLHRETGLVHKYALVEGTPRYITQGWDQDAKRSFLSFWPAPGGGKRYTISMSRVLDMLDSDSSDLGLPQAAVDAILDRLYVLWLTYSGDAQRLQALNPALLASRDSEDGLQRASRPLGVHIQGSRG